MAANNAMLQSDIQMESNGDCDDMNKILTVVVKRRRSIPIKCMEINKQIFALELQRLENAKIITEENDEKEKLKKVIQGFKGLQSFQFTLEDLYEAERKLQQCYSRIKDINSYLERRKKLLK